jgi:hypothetical protein
LDWSIFIGILKFAVPVEREWVGAFGTREIIFPFLWNGTKPCTFQRRKRIHSEPREIFISRSVTR